MDVRDKLRMNNDYVLDLIYNLYHETYLIDMVTLLEVITDTLEEQEELIESL